MHQTESFEHSYISAQRSRPSFKRLNQKKSQQQLKVVPSDNSLENMVSDMLAIEPVQLKEERNSEVFIKIIMGKFAEKAVCRSAFLTIWYCTSVPN